MEILFIRHGQPAWVTDEGPAVDPYLTPLGHKQAAYAAKRIREKGWTFDRLIMTSATRTQQTAEPIERVLDKRAEIIPGLVEIRLPDLRERSEKHIEELFQNARGRKVDEWWDGLSGGESFRAFHERIGESLFALLASHGVRRQSRSDACLFDVEKPSVRLCIVGHGGTNAVALTHLLGVAPAPWEWERFVLRHCAFARVKTISIAGAQVFSLRSFNDCEHLPDDERTR